MGASDTAEFKGRITWDSQGRSKVEADAKKVKKFLTDLEKLQKKTAHKEHDKASRAFMGSQPNSIAARLRRHQANVDKENVVRRQLGFRQLHGLKAQRPTFTSNMLKGLGMGGASAGFVGELVQAAPAIAAIAAGVYALKSAFDAVIFSVKTVTSVVFELGKSLVGATFHALDFTQRMELGFGALLKGKHQDPVGVFDAVRKDAQRLGLDVEDTTESFRKLLAAQFSVAESTTLTRSMADLQASGASATDIQHALLAISQIKMKGKLQAEELTRQLANAGVSTELVYQSIQERMGLPNTKEGREKVMALQQSGSISSDIAIPAIIEAISKKTGSSPPGEFALTKAQARVSGMLAQMKGMVTNTFIDVAQSIAEPVTAAMRTVFDSISRIASSPAFSALKTAFSNVFIETARFVQTYWPTIEPIITGVVEGIKDSFLNISEYIRDNGDTIAKKIYEVTEALFQIGSIMFAVTGSVYEFGFGFVSSIGQIKASINSLLYLLSPLKVLLAGIEAIAFTLEGDWGNAKAAAAAFFTGRSSVDRWNIQTEGEFDKQQADLQAAPSFLKNRSPGIPSSFQGGVPPSMLDALGGPNPWTGKTFNGNININVNADGLTANEELGNIVADHVRRTFNKALDDH